MTGPMTDERLARLHMDNDPRGDHLSGLTADDVGELIDEVDRLWGQVREFDALALEYRAQQWAAEGERDQARARLDEAVPLRIEWTTDDAYANPGDREILDFQFALDRVAKYPAIHRQLLHRQVWAGPWLASGGAVGGDRMPTRADVEQQAGDGRVRLTRRTPEESRAYLIEHRDEQIAQGVPAEVIDALIAATHDEQDHES
jgi:hypothetical protein